jgi:hypothetical protein
VCIGRLAFVWRTEHGLERKLSAPGFGPGGAAPPRGPLRQTKSKSPTQVINSCVVVVPTLPPQIPNSWANFMPKSFGVHALSREASRGCQEVGVAISLTNSLFIEYGCNSRGNRLGGRSRPREVAQLALGKCGHCGSRVVLLRSSAWAGLHDTEIRYGIASIAIACAHVCSVDKQVLTWAAPPASQLLYGGIESRRLPVAATHTALWGESPSLVGPQLSEAVFKPILEIHPRQLIICHLVAPRSTSSASVAARNEGHSGLVRRS